MLRINRIGPEMVDERIYMVVHRLRESKFLEGTVFEKRAQAMAMDPYSILLGIIIGIAVAVVAGMLTIEIWLPKAIARLTGRTVQEATKAVKEALAS